MATIFNKIIHWFVIIVPTLAIAFFLAYFVDKKIIKPGTEKVVFDETSLDLTEDWRGLGYSGQRKVVADERRNFFAAYRKKFQGKYEIFVGKITLENGRVLVSQNEKPIAAVSSGSDQRVPSIAVDSKDILHAVWYGSDGSGNEENNRQIKYSRSTDEGKNWLSWRNIAYVGGYDPKQEFWQEHPMMTVGGNDALYVVWEGKDQENSKQQIKFSKSLDGGNIWSRWKNINASAGSTQSRPVLVENSRGELYVFMYSSMESENSFQRIQYSVSDDKGETWSQWRAISGVQADARHLSAVSDKLGNIHIVWREGTEKSSSKIIYKRFSPSGGFVLPVAVSSSSNFQFFPSIGILPDGRPVVTWNETADPSGFPREDPRSGQILTSISEGGPFAVPKVVSGAGISTYPNLPSNFPDSKNIPIVYTEMVGEGKYLIKVKNLFPLF